MLNNKEAFKSKARIYQNPIDLNNANDPRKIIFDWISPCTQVLDIGCACGDLGIILKKYKNCLVDGCDINQESLSIARQNKCYKKLFQCDFNDCSFSEQKVLSKKYDYIILSDVIEHLIDVNSVLDYLSYFLKEDWKFLFSIPNIAHASIKASLITDRFDYTQTGILDASHLHFYTSHNIAQLFAKNNLLIKNVAYTNTDSIIGFQSFDMFALLPRKIKRYIFNDLESYICQYVIKSEKTSLKDSFIFVKNKKDSIEELFKKNQENLQINNHNLSISILQQQRKCLNSLTLGYWLHCNIDLLRQKLKIRTRLKHLFSR